MDNKERALKESQELFLSYVAEIQNKRVSEVAIRKAIKKFDVKNAKIQNLTPLRAKKIFASLISKHSNGYASSKNWLENERRLFIWCVVCYLYQSGKEISELTDQDFEFFVKLFATKDLSLLKFQAFSLIKKNSKSAGWKKEEDQVLMAIIQKKNLEFLEWNDISKQFFQNLGHGFFRSAKQCRERWLNHLDPHKVKGKWTREQDRLLLLDVIQKGKKWSQIVPTLDGKKNQHMIKNRFKSLIHKRQKEIKNSKLKQKELIHLILEKIGCESNQIKEIDECRNQQPVSIISEAERESPQEDKKKKSKFKNLGKQKEQICSRQGDYDRIKKENCLIVEPKNEFQKGHKKEEECCQVEDFFCDKNQGFLEKIIHTAPTPMPDNRLSSMFLEARSPANLVMSPFASGWTPIFFFDESQRQMSPQVNMGDFGSKFKSDFHKFVNE